MADCGVDVQIAKGGRTGTIVILIEPDGERTMLPDRGAAVQLEAIPEGALDGVAWLHVPGYSLIAEPLGTTSRGLIDSARAAGIPVSIDASSTGLLEGFGARRFEEELRAIQPEILFCNQDEAELLGVDHEHPFPGAGLSVIKAGPDPVLLVEPSRAAGEVPVPRVENVTDTTGAGDAFAAGYLVAKINGAAPVDAAVAGIELAATVLSRPGAGEHDH
jgi:sugar/nucleoside kinase (ribokinase family)